MTAPLTRTPLLAEIQPGGPSSMVRPTLDTTTMTTAEKELLAAAKGLQGVFLRQVVASMRSATNGLGGTPKDQAASVYQEWLDEKLADDWASRESAGLVTDLFLSLRERLPASQRSTP